VIVDGSSESISLTLSETEYAVEIVVEDGDGNVVDSANVTFDGVDGLTHNVKDGDYEINVTADNYVYTSQNVTVDGADDKFTVTLSEEEEAVIVSESSSEESGGMSTLVSFVLFFVLSSVVMVFLFGKD
jgi:ABC-type Na+ efflux pump permease subunit